MIYYLCSAGYVHLLVANIAKRFFDKKFEQASISLSESWQASYKLNKIKDRFLNFKKNHQTSKLLQQQKVQLLTEKKCCSIVIKDISISQ